MWSWLRWIPLAIVSATILSLGVAITTLDGLDRVFAWYCAQLLIPAIGALLLLACVVRVLFTRRWKSGAWLATTATGAAASSAALWTLGVVPIRFPSSLEDARPAAYVRVPLDGPVRVAWGGDALETNYHAASPDQRWAYDLLVEPYLTGSTRVEDYGCYGRPVLAPAAGVITLAQDGNPDHQPGAVSNDATNPIGNGIAIRLDETGTFLVIAHLAPGSVVVSAGDHVSEGDQLGACGNSGNTSEPHVHIHHQREDPATTPFGFAEGLPLYFRGHDSPPMPRGGLVEEGGRARAIGDVITHLASTGEAS